MCKECGFFYTGNGVEICHISKESVAADTGGECKTFFVRQYDGKEPLTPQEHEWLYRDILEKKKMTNMQGLKF
jgi:hypothetical protein